MLTLWSRLKYVLRNNNFYRNHFQKNVNEIRYLFKNLYLYFKYYQLKKDKSVSGNTIFLIIDSSRRHPGLADRLKVAVCIHYIAKINGFSFKMIFDYPFLLSDYIGTNKINWKANRSDLSFSLYNSRLIAYNGKGRLPKLNKKIKQYHVYLYHGTDILISNNISNYKVIWYQLFNELFKPTPLLTKELENQKFKENSYIAIHLRFVNALENFEEGEYNSLNDNQKKNLTDRCLGKLLELKQNHKSYPIVVFSDSKKFLNLARENGFDIIEGNVGHISFNGKNTSIILKTFLDFYMISRAKKIYRITAPELYGSVFAKYAALSMGKEMEKINI